ncbi:hypothetical protein J7376_09275, partial [Paracoccus sp. R12_1]
LAQHTHDLGFCVSCLLHRNLLSHPAEKILLPHPVKIGGDYRSTVASQGLNSGGAATWLSVMRESFKDTFHNDPALQRVPPE